MWSEYDEPMYVERCLNAGRDPYPEETLKKNYAQLQVSYNILLEKYNDLIKYDKIYNQNDFDNRRRDDNLYILGHIKVSPDDTGALKNLDTWKMIDCPDTSEMFVGCDIQSDISEWQLHSCLNAESMMRGCYTFNQNIEKWMMPKCKNLCRMFEDCTSFNGDISMWMIPDDADTRDMFKKND